MAEPKNENQVIIFFDLDGVLSDFDLHLHNENKLTADGKTNWDALDYQWWSTMPVIEGAKEFYDEAKTLGKAKFLTAPVMGQDCFAGKAAWIQKFLPERGKFALMDLIICPSGDKLLLAGGKRILIDDREKNIQEWEAAGGIGIHHNGDFKATMQKLREKVAQLTTAPQPAPTAPKCG